MNPTYRHHAPTAHRDYGEDLSEDGDLPTQAPLTTGLQTLHYIAVLPRQSWPVQIQDCHKCRHVNACSDYVFAKQITICEAASIARGILPPYEPPPVYGRTGNHYYKGPKQ